MFIHEAAKKATATGKGMFRKSWEKEGREKSTIIPTNTGACCIGYIGKDELVCRWQPFAEDLLADDWDV